MKAHQNPFRSSKIDSLPFLFETSNSREVFDRLVSQQYRGAIVGPKGSGKTTLLDTLEPLLHEQGVQILRIHLKSDRPNILKSEWNSLRQASKNTIVILDGAEQIGIWSWQRIKRITSRCGGLVITSHTPGRLPTFFECKTSASLFQRIVLELVPAEMSPDSAYLDKLFQIHNGNIREALFELYDICMSVKRS